MSHIFISYSHKDKSYAHKLKKALEHEGFQVWIDDHIDYGDEWPIVIQDRLDACDAFVLIATEDSYRSTWVRKEVTRAQRINKPFFPLLLSGQPWLTIESTQYVDVRDGSLPTERFYQRLRAVMRRPKPEPVRPPSVAPPPPKRPRISTGAFQRYFVSVRSRLSRAIPAPKTIGLASIVIVIFFASGWSLVTLIRSLQVTAAADALMAFSVLSQNESGVFAYDIRSGSAYPVDLGAGNNWDPTVSRFGNIYFTSDREDGNAEIYRFVNGIVEPVTDTPGNYQSWDPALSRNGTLYFTSDQHDDKAEIYRLVNAQAERVTETPGVYQSWGPVISLNGTVYYTSNRKAGKAEIYRLVNGTPEPVTDTPGSHESWGPVISPSGAVYYTTDRNNGKAEIYRLIDGVSERVTDTPSNFQSWGPVVDSDGTIYYTSNRGDGKRRVYRLVEGDPEPIPFVSGQAESFTDFLKRIAPDF